MNNEPNIQATPLDLDSIRTIYFVGIGGIGMSAIARYCLSKGMKVSGYDKTRTPLTEALEAEGMAVHYSEDLQAIPMDADVVVYTPAIPKQHAELVYYQQNGYRVVKRSDILQAISSATFNICVAGTHGKTTISTMVAHILRHSGYGCNAFLGGISANYNTNFWSSERAVAVIEADEYDRSFLKLSPDIAVITSMDADHLDIYGDEASMQDAFVAFGNKVKESGLLITRFGLPRTKEISSKRKLTYSLTNEYADVFTTNLQIRGGGYRFDVRLPDTTLNGLELKVGGSHNVENALVAIAIANSLRIDDEKIKNAVAAFTGVKRRFEYVIPPEKKEEGSYIQPVLVDDYAHHPEELRALLTSVRKLFPQRLVTVVFQPHLFTRTRDLADGFADALSIADTVVLLPIYPARELPIEGVSSSMILDKIRTGHKELVDKGSLVQWVKEHQLNKEFGEVIVMAGAGDIDTLVGPVKQAVMDK